MRNTFEKIAEKVIRRLGSRSSSRPPELATGEAMSHAAAMLGSTANGKGQSLDFSGGQETSMQQAWSQMVMPAFDDSSLLDQSNREMDDTLRDTLDNWLRLPIGTLTDLDWSYLGRD